MKTTNPELNRQMIYSVFVRNHTKEGTFAALEKDLDRIKSLGTEILWLMPLYPVGKVKRKGKDGSPYAIADYEQTNPEMGTVEEFEHLVKTAHEKGMKVIVDVVYNHTSPDSKLYENHPEWFYKDENGEPSSLVKDWSDIIDLDYSQPELSDELSRILSDWGARCDGFRCDVASRVPLEFWKKARKEADEKNPNLFWLAESVHQPFLQFIREQGRYGASDGELYEVFDAEYDYDIWPFYEAVLKGEKPISAWLEELERQETVYPQNFIKMHCLENHDNERFAAYISDEYQWKNWTALLFMLKGMPLIYHGQEFMNEHRPSIFDQDVVHPEGKDQSRFIAALAQLHANVLPAGGPVRLKADDEQGTAFAARQGFAGIFALKTEKSLLKVPFQDGLYENLISGKTFEIQNHMVSESVLPVIFRSDKSIQDLTDLKQG